MTGNWRRRHTNRASEYASVLAVLAEMWNHNDPSAAPATTQRPDPTPTRLIPSRDVVSLAAYRSRRLSRQREVAEAI
ncbi:MAG: hypothetical protein ACRD29_17665 [Acidimicrobiales bacterium]